LSETLILSYRYRLLPSKRQHAALKHVLEEQRILYNAALQERIECYKKTGKSRSYMDQCQGLSEWRKEDVEFPANLQRWTLKRLDNAYSAFFRRLKKNSGKAGFPRFRSKNRWKSFGFAEFAGIRLKNNRLYFKGIPSGLKIHLHRQLPENADIRSCTFTHDLKGWYVSLQVKIPCAEKREIVSPIGIDVGLKEFAVFSDETVIPNPRIAKKAQKQLRVAQRALSRAKRGSKRRLEAKRRVAVLHRKIANTRNTFLHQISAAIVKQYDAIAVEKLNVANMVQSTMAKSIHDASWSAFFQMLNYKAARAGVQLVSVDPRNTSQLCSGCGAIVKKRLKDRVHACEECGLVLDRDHNAAINILERAMNSFSGVAVRKKVNVDHRITRSSENVSLLSS
jgi:transposase, IS605 OrfB family, central region